MKIRFFSLLIMTALFVAQTPFALAQGTPRQWTAVQAIAVDERLIVKQKDGKTVEGRMIEASDTNLTLSKDKKVLNISRDNIAEIHHSIGKAKKGKWALIGAGIGAGAGTLIGAAKYDPDVDDSELFIPVGLLIGTGAGALSGMFFGASKRHRELIYRAP